MEENEQEHEAVKDRGFAVIDDREKAALGVHHEISHGHFAARNEGGDAGEQANRDQEATDQLNYRADIHYSLAGAMPARWKTEKLLPAVRSEEKAHEQPHDAISRIRETRQRVHGLKAVRRAARCQDCYLSWQAVSSA